MATPTAASKTVARPAPPPMNIAMRAPGVKSEPNQPVTKGLQHERNHWLNNARPMAAPVPATSAASARSASFLVI
jgi:hypothetical protein